MRSDVVRIRNSCAPTADGEIAVAGPRRTAASGAGVLANLARAVRPSGLVYLTVQELEQHHIQRAFEGLCARGLPAVRDELVEGDTPG